MNVDYRSLRDWWCIYCYQDLFFREILFENKEAIKHVLVECVRRGTTVITDY